jgi:hypothetical protein
MKSTITGLILLAGLQGSAQTMHDSITVAWHTAGLENPVPAYTTIMDVTAFGAVPGDLSDDQPAVASAISALNGNSGVIYFPAGTFVFHSSINLSDSVILRGAGSDSTLFRFDFSNAPGNSINVGGYASGPFFPLISGFQKGSFGLVIADADSVFFSGDEIEIRQVNGAWDTNPASWADYSVGHLSRIDSVRGDTIWMHEALRIDFDAALSPEVRKIVTRNQCGLECFKMIRDDGSTAGVNFGVNFSYASNCWMRGVESQKSVCAHVTIDASSHVEISGCYFHESYIYDGASTHGYGVVIFSHACSNLVEDNVFRMLRHAMVCKQGANGNVFGYNYSREPNRSEPIADYAADICLHGHYAFANLFEGNIAQNLQVDQAWGPSGPDNAFFRNKIENYGIIMSSGTVQSDRQIFVGNDVSNMTLFHGMYTLAGTGHFEYGNNVRGTITPNGTSTLTDTTCYLGSVPPSFWSIQAALPSVGIPNTYASDINPAMERYNQGGILTLCGFPADTTIVTQTIPHQSNTFYVKNYFKDGAFTFEITGEKNSEVIVELFTIAGQRIHMQNVKIKQGRNEFMLRPAVEISEAIYIFHIYNLEMSCSGMFYYE